ncbi:MAG: hypothetical protein AMXMBFR23_03310 [Chloroflexota bacterium]
MSAVAEVINPYRMFTGAFVPWWLLERPEVDQGAKLAYAVLARHADRDTGEASPTAETLAADLGVSTRQAARYVADLVAAGLVESVRRGLGQPNLYRFLAHPWMDAPQASSQASEGLGEPSAEASREASTRTRRQTSAVDTGVQPDRTHMSTQDVTRMSTQERTSVSGHTSSGETGSEDGEEREILSAPLTGHAGLLFADLTEALPDVPAWELRRWVREHADLPIATAQALAAAARGRPVKSVKWLDAALERGIAPPAAGAAAGERSPRRGNNPYDANVDWGYSRGEVRDELAPVPGETFEAYWTRLVPSRPLPADPATDSLSRRFWNVYQRYARDFTGDTDGTREGIRQRRARGAEVAA